MTLVETRRSGHATRLAQSAAGEKLDLVVVLGGDGTVNEAANGLAGSATALATLPGGSTNVLARILGLPDDPADAALVVLEAIAKDAIYPIGLGSVQGRYFLFHCGVGFDAAVVEQVENRGPWKRWAGHPLFVWAAFDTWLRGTDRTKPYLHIANTEGVTIAESAMAVVMNTNPYTYLGNRPINLIDGLSLHEPLAVVSLGDLKARNLSSVIVAALRGKDLSRKRSVKIATDLQAIKITAEVEAPYQVDGDYLGTRTSLNFSWSPNMLRLLMPNAS